LIEVFEDLGFLLAERHEKDGGVASVLVLPLRGLVVLWLEWGCSQYFAAHPSL
jgi:hypothetical protein